MKNLIFFLFLIVFACQNAQTGPWADFKKCATNACVKEVVAVTNAFLADPKPIFANFKEGDETGEDHYIGWLYILRDSVLVNSNYASIEDRFALQQKIIDTARPFVNDPKYGDFAKSIVSEIEMLAIASELEDDIVEPSDLPITGIYGFEKPNDAGSGELQISQISIDKFKFKLNVVGGPPAHNQGFMEGEATLMGNSAVFSLNEFGGECKLEFTFGEGVAIKTLTGEPAVCGFGNNIMADGKYARSSFADPFLSKKDAKTASGLLGEWVSATDPKAVLKISDGKFTDVYDGEEMDNSTYIFFPTCPKDCNPVAKTPCLKVMSQDEVCFTIVKADGKTLEISQIDGPGNTLKYVKKAALPTQK